MDCFILTGPIHQHTGFGSRKLYMWADLVLRLVSGSCCASHAPRPARSFRDDSSPQQHAKSLRSTENASKRAQRRHPATSKLHQAALTAWVQRIGSLLHRQVENNWQPAVENPAFTLVHTSTVNTIEGFPYLAAGRACPNEIFQPLCTVAVHTF
jgi:hypothetical protein